MVNFLVKTENLGRIYLQGGTEVEALSSATCSVKSGDRIALMGPSGSGKTTLLHLLGGLVKPTSGSISWPGLGDPRNLRPHNISLVFQTPSLLPPLTVLENVLVPLLLKGAGEAAARAMALDILEQMGLDAITEKLPEEISGGQAQRAAMARAMACKPRLILADEPTGQLDHQTAHHMFDFLLETLYDSETAVVIATHDPAVAERMREIWDIQHGVLAVKKHV
jgi:ABC-type lipoprotein export system ATPase subunit